MQPCARARIRGSDQRKQEPDKTEVTAHAARHRPNPSPHEVPRLLYADRTLSVFSPTLVRHPHLQASFKSCRRLRPTVVDWPIVFLRLHTVPDGDVLGPRRRRRMAAPARPAAGQVATATVFFGGSESRPGLVRSRAARVRTGFRRLPQDQRQPANIGREQDLLRVFRIHFEGHRLGDRRLLGALAGDLINGENFGGLQDDVWSSSDCFCISASVRIRTTSTRSPGSMKPATPRTSSTRTVTARFRARASTTASPADWAP